MENAVALVRTYLQLNGYFTVTEYPIVETREDGHYKCVTDLDVLAFRFPSARGTAVGKTQRKRKPPLLVDEHLGTDPTSMDMIIAEVKEGKGRFNRNLHDKEVLACVLERFGCVDRAEIRRLVTKLSRKGFVVTADGRKIRLIIFASERDRDVPASTTVVELSHVLQYIESHIDRYWQMISNSQSKDPAFSFLVTLRKAAGGARRL
jgi:hypothetical protein